MAPLDAGGQKPSMCVSCFVDSDVFSREQLCLVRLLTSCEMLHPLLGMWYAASGVSFHIQASLRHLVYSPPIKYFNQFPCLGHFCGALNEGKSL